MSKFTGKFCFLITQPLFFFRNACPVREEVFAPYWANNTRDNTLAILNLYPFEQYIHMETCRFENEEMLCRKGCKCEQQYRLHRLLAFDPTKECRGIFSDWFRFPSYCVCKFNSILIKKSHLNFHAKNDIFPGLQKFEFLRKKYYFLWFLFI